MKEECLICKAPLEYLEEGVLMECALCHKKEMSRTRCTNGHYVCDECHTQGVDAVAAYCLEQDSRDPHEILEGLMALPFCHMHGPEHHILVGSSLLTAYKNAGGEIGGPRCCKRNSYAAVTEAVHFAEEHLGVRMELKEILCSHSGSNGQCIGKRCPYNKVGRK